MNRNPQQWSLPYESVQRFYQLQFMSPRERMMAGVAARKHGPTASSFKSITLASAAPLHGESPPSIAYRHVRYSNPPREAAGRRTEGTRRREEGVNNCGDTFADKITIRVGGRKATIRPVVTPRDFGDGSPGSVGWGTDKEIRLKKKLIKKINKLITRLGRSAGQIAPDQNEDVADLLQEAMAHIEAVGVIHDRWKNRSGGFYPLAWSDDPAKYLGDNDAARRQGQGGASSAVGAWATCGGDTRLMWGCDPADVAFREQLSPAWRIDARPFGAASVESRTMSDAPLIRGPGSLGPPHYGAVRGGMFFPECGSGSENKMEQVWQVRCPTPIDISLRQDDRSQIWDHYMSAAKNIRCAQFRLWSAILEGEAGAPTRSPNPGPQSGLDPIDPFEDVTITLEPVDPFGSATPAWTTRMYRGLRRMANPAEAIGSAAIHGVRKVTGIF